MQNLSKERNVDTHKYFSFQFHLGYSSSVAAFLGQILIKWEFENAWFS